MRRLFAVRFVRLEPWGGGTKIFGADGAHSVRDGKSPINRVPLAWLDRIGP